MSMAAAHLDSKTYRRQARRLRHVFRHKPGELHLSLRQLSDRHDAAYQATSQPRGWKAIIRQPARDFADEVARQMDSKVLPYSKRLALLDAAENEGIGRFQANLIIAAVQHQMADEQAPSTAPTGRALSLAPVLAFVVVQSVILLALWAVLM